MDRTRLLIVLLLLAGFLSVSGCTAFSDSDNVTGEPDSPKPIPAGPQADVGAENKIGDNSLASELQIQVYF